ncbi:golvesin C-terminal-like domain-containing protein [Gimesia panareensis]|uniref:golvesin C-terminal-like domain-containing protein n=1 Tax=Gimesia panareensis TaxID=2527978 RepID=UPI00118C50A4|nr:choice-of-anchor D domain-containing protein [Gimesia panareensis]QDU49563.1 hypothetical protein Pan110_19010 [Gimesia panareensis]
MLLTNWLANVTSRLRKRPVFRSRDRRAIRQRWQTALSNQISTTEVLEDRTLLTTFFVDDDYTAASDFTGTDTDPGTGGDQNAVWNVTAFATIQEAVTAAAASGDTIQVAAGTYNENITLSKQVDLVGAQAGVDARGRGGTLDDSLASIIAPAGGTGLDLQNGSAGTTIDGFTFSGGTTGIASSSGTIDDLQILNNQFVGFTGSGVFLNNSGDDITVHQNVIDGTSQAGGGGIFHLDQDTFDGFHFTSNWVLNGDTGFFVDGTRNVSSSASRDPLFEDNLFDGNGAGANFGRFGVENAVVQNNVFSNNAFDGLQGGIQNSLITMNTFDTNDRAGLRLTGFGDGDPTSGAQGNTVEENIFLNNGAGTSASGYGDVRLDDQFDGTISTNTFFNNSFGSTVAVFNNETSGETVDFSGNWWGTNDDNAVLLKQDGAGALAVDFTFYLGNGTDTDGGTAGFQGDFSTLHVTALGAQTGSPDRIAEALAAVTPGGTVKISSGTYNENVNTTATGIDKSVTLAPGNSPGQVIINGDLILNADDTLDIEVNGATAGSGFDQFVVSGTVDLGGAALNLIDGYDPVDGDVFTLIQNDGANPVTGTFPGLPEGYEFTDFLGSGLSAYITYVGGNGNDVVIHMVDSTPEVDLPVDGNPDDYSLEIDGTNVVIKDVNTGDIISSTPLAALQGTLVINGEDGQDDTLSIDMTGIDDTTPLQIQFNGGVGGNDTLELLGGSLNSVEHIFTSNSSGSVQLNGSGTDFISYTGLEPIVDTILVNDRTFSFTGAAETITLSDDGGVGNGQSQIDSDLFGESVTFLNATNNVIIKTTDGTGADNVHIEGVDSLFDANLTVNAGTDDAVTFQSAATNVTSGNVDINAGIINLNAAVTTAGNVALDATNGSISGTSLVTAANAELQATGSVGGLGTEVELAVSGLEANVGSILFVNNTGALSIGYAGGGLTGVSVGNGFTITSTGTVSVTEDATSSGSNPVYLESSTGDVLMTSGTQIGGGTGNVEVVAANNVQLGLLSTSNNISVTATAGAISDNNAGSNNFAGHKATLVAGTGAGVGDALEAQITYLEGNTGAGGLELENTGTLVIGDAGGLTGVSVGGASRIATTLDLNVFENLTSTGSGLIQLESYSDVIQLLAEVDAGTGNAELTAATNVYLGSVTTSGGDVSVTATTGLISDSNAGSNNINANHATLTAASGVGVGESLETTISALEANTGSDGLFLDNTGTLDLGFAGGLASLSVGGASLITSTDTMTVIENVTASGGSLELQNTGGNFNLNGTSIISNDGSNLIEIDSAGAVTMADGTQITNSGDGLIDIDAVNNIALSSVSNSGFFGEAQITSSAGSITDNTGGEGVLINVSQLALRAATGIGAAGAGDLDIGINALAAISTTGDIYLHEGSLTDVATVNGLSGITAGGNINLDIGGTLNLIEKVEATGPASTITLNGSADINVYDQVLTNGGAIDLLADNVLLLSVSSLIDTSSAATVTLKGDADGISGGVFTQADGGQVDAHGGLIDVSGTDGVWIANLQSTGGIVQVLSSMGAIQDNTFAEASLITAAQAGLYAKNGVGGVASADLETQVGTLAAFTLNNDVVISNTGGLVIGDVLPVVGVASVNGFVNVTAFGSLQVSSDVVAGNYVSLRAYDSAAAGEDLTIDAGKKVQSLGSSVTLNAGDNLNVNSTASVISDSADISITVDYANLDPGTGGVANLNGTLDAATIITVTGGTDADQVIIDGNGGGLNDGGTVDGIMSLFKFDGNGNTDELIVDDSGDGTGDNIIIQNTGVGVGSVIGAGAVTLSYEDLEDLTVYSGTDADDITVNPNVLTTINIVGGDPAAPTMPADSLTYLTPPFESSNFTPDGLDGGTISSTGSFQDVLFDEIENLNFAGSLTVSGTTGDDTLEITATGADSGTYQINGGPVISFSGITDFTFNGDDGDDTLIINNPVGGLFDPPFGIFYNGQGNTGVGDTLEIVGGTAGSVEHEFTNDNDGFVYYNGSPTASITYTGLEPISDTILANDRTFSFTGGAETITLSDDGGVGNGQSQIDSDLFGESVTYLNATNNVIINTEVAGGFGADTVIVNAVDSLFSANLTVNAGNDDTLTLNTADIGAGNADLNANQVNVNGTFTTSGTVDVDANDQITFAAAGIIDATANTIDLTAGNNIQLGQITTSGDVTVTATTGAITDANAGNNITANNATLTAGASAGFGDPLETAIAALEANIGAGLELDNTGALNIGFAGGINGVQVGAPSTITSTDTMTVTENVAATGGNLLLQNTGGNFNLNALAIISNNSTFEIGIDSAGAVTLADTSTVTSSGTGLIDIDAVNNIALANVNTSGEVQVTTSAGAITDNSGSEAALITADTAALRAATGIGVAGAGDIDLAINTMAADTTAGDIFLQEPSAATVGIVDGLIGMTAPGHIFLAIGGTLNINQKIEATGAASIVQANVQGDINVNNTVQTNGGEINLYADDNLVLGASSLVDTTTAELVRLLADFNNDNSGGFTQAEGSLVNARGGDLIAQAYGDAEIADLQSAGGRVVVGSEGGSIVDNTGGEVALITAAQAALSALNGIGVTGTGDIDTAVGTLSAFTTNNDVVISNTGALIIGDVAPLSGVTSTNGAVSITTFSPLTVASNVTAAGTVTLTATDNAGPGDDLTINGGGVTVESTGADVVLNSGDDFLLSLGGSVIADTTITVNIDPITDGAGATVDLLGNVDATLTTINGGDDSDIFNILPTSDSPINIVGGNPTLPGPGDTLNMDFSGLASDPYLTLGGAAGSGTFSFVAPDTELPVTYSSIEEVNTSTGAYHLVLDMVNSGFQNAADDMIDVSLDAGGTNLLIDINSSNFFTGAAADILSFTVLGSNDNESLNINETAGGLPFFATAAPSAVSGSNGAHLNAAADYFLEDIFNPNTYDVNDITIHYDGKNGTDAINVNFLTDHDAAYFSDNIDGLGSGNIAAAAVGDTDIDLGLSFGNVEAIGLSGSGTGGGLHVDASSTPATNALNINDDANPGDGVSRITGNGGFTDLLFEDFTDLQVLSGTGAELIDLIALDSATTLTNVELDADDVFAADDTANDTIRIRTTPSGTVTDINILAGLGDDLIQAFGISNSVNNIHATLYVDGEGGDDTLTIIDSGDGTGDTFEVTSTTVDGLSGTAGTDAIYSNIDNLNVTGTAGDDTANINLGLQEDLNNVTINGAGGDDDFNVQNSTPAGVNTVLNGQAGNDEFFFLGSNVLRGFINGGGNVDTIDYSGYTPVVHVELTGLGSTDGFQGTENNGSILGTGPGGTGFDNIDNLLGSAGVDTLEGPNLNNYWGVTSTDEGFIIAERNNLAIGRPTLPGDAIATPPEERLDFTSFQNLIGGTQDDRFDLSDGAGLTGTLDGDAGNDSLDYRDYTTGVNVDLFAGTATNIGGGLVAGTGGGDDDNSIENVFGGDGNDDITGDNDNNILGDGLGSDLLDGGGYGVGSGNGGNDVFLMEPGAGGSADVITDIHGNDTVDFRFASAGIVFDVDIINTPQDVFGGNTVELRQLQPEQPDTNPSFMENVVGSEFDDYIFIDPLSQDGNFPIDGPPVLRSADGRGGTDTLDFDAKGQAVIDTGYSLTADGVGTVQYLNFENVTPFEDNPATIVDDGDLGFSLEGDWPYHPAGTAATTTGIGYEDDVHTVQSQLVDPVHYGDARAFWEFYGLTPGVYRVSVTWPASDNAFVIPTMATDAPYTVFDGSRNDVGTTAVDLGTFDLNQQLAPNDFQADGALWEDLGTFTINSRTLTVMLTNLADGLITADAVRIERVSAGPEVQLTDVTDVAAPPVVLVDGNPGGIDFGTTELLTDLTRTFEITNTGSAPLNISNIVIPTGFTTTLTAQSVAVGNTISFDITMDSTAFGDRSGLFSFDTDDVDEATFNLLLHGQVSNVVIIDNGDADFSATAGFETYTTGVNLGASGYEDDIAGAIPNQPGNTPAPAGTDTATWTFSGLADGFYRVSTTWPALYNRAADAPFSLDGGAGTFDLPVNQTLTPSSFAEDGTAWFDLNTSFEVVGGVLTVTLTNDADSAPRDHFDLANGVIADAVRIEYLPTPDLEVTVDGNVVDDDTGVVDFGTTIPGIPVAKTFTITNLSADAVDVTGLIEFPPGFSIDPASPFGTDTVPVNIAGFGSVTFTVQFDGGTTGSTYGQLSFTTGDADENPYNFTVVGAAGPATVGINDTDFATSGSWTGHTPGDVGDPEFLYTGEPYVGGTGTNQASWTFDVEPGRYQVVAHWYVHPDVSPYGRAAATNAPYTIFSDATPVATYRVSQQTSSDDFLDDGTWWEYIGDPVVINDSTLTVRLSDDADGIVYADAVRIIRVVDPVIKVEVDGGAVEDGGTVDFEDTIIGAPVVKTFTVTNFGERNMALGPINVPTGFSLVTGFGDTNLAPGASTTFSLQMDASVGGSFSGMVSFGADLAEENPFNFTVSGSAADSMIVDNGDLAYSTSGAAWQEQQRGSQSDLEFYQQDQDVLLGGDLLGTNTATWTFDNLGAGTYQVASHWMNHSSFASNAQITIGGIEGGPITVSLDQRFYPQGFSADGTIWQELGNFQVTAGGTLTVTITDDGADGDLAADAMRLELIPPGLTAPEIDVQAGATALTSGVSNVDLGTAFFGETLSQTFTITNTGTNTLNLGAISLPGSGEYTVSSPLGTTNLAAGHSTTFEISFSSTGVAGPVGGVVSIVTNDSDENPFTFNIAAEMTDVLIIDDGDAAYNSVGNWDTQIFDSRYFQDDGQTLNFGQSGTATWDFTGLAAGTYTVSATWYSYPSPASNAEFNVSGVGPVVINQQVAPNDFTADGADWEILSAAVVVGGGGSITVTLSDNGPADGAIIADAIRIQRTGPLLAAAGASSTSAPSITQSDLDSVVDAALSYWESAGLSDAQLELLQSVNFVLADLPDAMLGGAAGTTVLIDVNAAGYGWFVDGTPLDSSEFTLIDGSLLAGSGSAAFGQMDLLTVVMHELGHTLGLEDLATDGTLMSDSLDVSERRLPTEDDLDAFFSAISGGDNPLLD